MHDFFVVVVARGHTKPIYVYSIPHLILAVRKYAACSTPNATVLIHDLFSALPALPAPLADGSDTSRSHRRTCAECSFSGCRKRVSAFRKAYRTRKENYPAARASTK